MSRKAARLACGRPARAPLFGALKRAVALAQLVRAKRGPRAWELLDERAERRHTRRELLRASAASAVALATAPVWPRHAQAETRPKKVAPRVAIVGAGITGLCAAYALKRAGLTATLYEASKRTGGRICTARGVIGAARATELGGEFIDSTHRDMLALVRSFGLELLDMEDLRHDDHLRDSFFFGGRHYSEAQVVEAFEPLAERMEADCDEIEDEIDFEHEGGAGAIDRMSIAEYLDRIKAGGWVRKLIDVAYVVEYGLDCDRLSALNLLSLISTDVSADHLALYGQSDERFRIKGGNQQLTDALAGALGNQIAYEHRLEAVRSAGEGLRLSFAVAGGRSTEVEADFVIVTLPFSVLRQVALDIELPPLKKKVIAELGYGTNTKLLAGLARRVWRAHGASGTIFSDEPFQTGWDPTRTERGESGGFTMFLGGKAGVQAGAGSASDQVQKLVGGLDRAFPGTAQALNGTVARFHWPSYPFALGSYACYLPGQWTTIAGSEGKAVGNLLFAGEHCYRGDSGFMNSGAASGRVAARKVLARAGWRRAR